MIVYRMALRRSRCYLHRKPRRNSLQMSSMFSFSLIVNLGLVLCVHITAPSILTTPQKRERVSSLLEQLLNDDVYDTAIRPGLEDGPTDHLGLILDGRPVSVSVDIYVKSVGPIEERRMKYALDCYFRQSWLDPRLKFPEKFTEEVQVTNITLNTANGFDGAGIGLPVPSESGKRVWLPDTIVLNSKNSQLHTLSNPNKFIRVHHNGEIIYSLRLTIRADCRMDFRNYPLDAQHCPIVLGSCLLHVVGHSARDIVYKWKYGPLKAVAFSPELGLSLSQFALAGYEAEEYFAHDTKGWDGMDSQLSVKFHLQRNITYFLIQVYIPCYLTVFTSWISFWINREASQARVTLGITTLLTAATLTFTSDMSNDPRPAYSTAMDIFLMICFTFIFCSLLEYATVNYFTYITVVHFGGEGLSPRIETRVESSTSSGKGFSVLNLSGNGFLLPFQPEEQAMLGLRRNVRRRPKYPWWKLFFFCLTGSIDYRNERSFTKNARCLNSVSKVDRCSRVLFPLSFLIVNIIYWWHYLGQTQGCRTYGHRKGELC